VTANEIAVRRTKTYDLWFARLRDARAKARIAVRIDRLQRGNAGDHRSVGDGVMELKVDYGPGYRVYYIRRASTLVLLLCGGDKSSQSGDIQRAKAIALLPDEVLEDADDEAV